MSLVRMRHQAALRARVHVHDDVRTGPKGDPTGTADLRRRYSSLVEFRWRKVRALLRGALVTQDMLGVDQSKQSALSIAMTALPTDGKIRAFQNWLDKTLSMTTLETDTTYLDPMIVAAYRRGVARAVRLTQGQTQPPAADDAIASLQQLVMVEMQGINEAVSQQCVRAVSDGLLSGKSGKQLFADCAAVVDKIGIVRSRAMVELMTVKAHGTATLDQFEAAGIKKVGLLPESVRVIKKKVADMRVQDAPRKIGPGSLISRLIQPSLRTIQRIRAVSSRLEGLGEVDILTAGDFDVCPECQGIADDGPYDIDEARSLIPAHPYCRCSFVPAEDARFAGDALHDYNPYHDPATGEFASGGGEVGSATHAVEFRLQPSSVHEYGKRQTMHVRAMSSQEAASKVVEHHKAAGAFHTRVVKVTNLNTRRIYVPRAADANPYHDPETGEFTFGPGGGVQAFHGTSEKLANKISNEGIKVSHDKTYPHDRTLYASDRGHSVFVTATEKHALNYARERAMNTGGGRPVVFKLEIPKKEWATFKADEEEPGVISASRTKAIPARWIKSYRVYGPKGSGWSKPYYTDADVVVRYMVVVPKGGDL